MRIGKKDGFENDTFLPCSSTRKSKGRPKLDSGETLVPPPPHHVAAVTVATRPPRAVPASSG